MEGEVVTTDSSNPQQEKQNDNNKVVFLAESKDQNDDDLIKKAMGFNDESPLEAKNRGGSAQQPDILGSLGEDQESVPVPNESETESPKLSSEVPDFL